MTKPKRTNISNDKTELRRQEQIFLFEALPLLVHFSLGPRSSLVRLSLFSRSLFVSLSKTYRGPNEEQAKNERENNEKTTRKQRKNNEKLSRSDQNPPNYWRKTEKGNSLDDKQ